MSEEAMRRRLIAKARYGNVEEGNCYWLEQGERKCTVCNLKIRILRHSLKNCYRLDSRVASWK